MGERVFVRQVGEPQKPVDITKLYIDFSNKYRNVFIVQIQGETYIYRALGRGEYKEIMQDKRFDDLAKEEIVCDQCLLYPDPDTIDWDKIEAGVPTELYKAILTDSYLDDIVRRRSLHDYYRSEMYDLDNQITCIIQEAFPNLELEEIESWDVDKTTKYLSRAEWKLHNLRGLPFAQPQGELMGNEYSGENDMDMGYYEQEAPQVQKTFQENDNTKTIRGGERAAKLTPEQMKKRAEFLQKFPEFANDDIILHGIDGLAQDTCDVSPALRVGR